MTDRDYSRLTAAELNEMAARAMGWKIDRVVSNWDNRTRSHWITERGQTVKTWRPASDSNDAAKLRAWARKKFGGTCEVESDDGGVSVTFYNRRIKPDQPGVQTSYVYSSVEIPDDECTPTCRSFLKLCDAIEGDAKP